MSLPNFEGLLLHFFRVLPLLEGNKAGEFPALDDQSEPFTSDLEETGPGQSEAR